MLLTNALYNSQTSLFEGHLSTAISAILLVKCLCTCPVTSQSYDHHVLHSNCGRHNLCTVFICHQLAASGSVAVAEWVVVSVLFTN